MFSALTALYFVIGLMVGSFLNVVILRIDDLKTILYTRSHCPKCKKVLQWYDLVPFLSFMMLGGKCRYCGSNISYQYPIVEIGVGLFFAFLFTFIGQSWGLIFYLLTFSILTVVLVYDIKTQTVPEVFVWIALVLSLLGGWYFGGFTFSSALIAALIAGGFLGILVFFSKEQWMGSGDIKLGLILGLLTGFPNVIFALFFSFILGSVAGIIYIFFKDKRISRESLKQSLPFAPFLILSALVSIAYATNMLSWYLDKFKF